jgi:hypothetical protein
MVTLPSDFGKEITCLDTTNSQEIPYIDIQDLYTDYASTVHSSGSFQRYTIADGVNEDGVRYKYLRPHYLPATAYAVNMPYTIKPLALASAGGYTTIPCEDIMVLGATAEAWRQKRQFAKAADFDLLYEKGIQTLLWDQANQLNQTSLFNPVSYSRETI